ncbi:GNAT family N-acetyltransferase [Candidatus Trichorickettsia mobilis]|uniref:GNAT family N-acetyltransferase n=1 Tax=Candidatus Trichorickettsia mobilis TaxID=1346319 RepID=A0ABZ0UUX8_9RICK|nr:GNAT family N-acetyltransferase [Candidatus Trichorickettsia mobilis]WPY00714.1 GNAT family N-acetyltransferase [Candidatus Trichorickettsia mobilis]
MKINFKKVTSAHLDTIFSWLTEPHVMEFWDNTQAHKDDIVNFTEGRKTPSSYADGQYVYWIASLEHEPFAMLMTIQETHKEDIGPEKLKRLSKTGNTYGLDYMIGNPKFFGKGYGSQTLRDFIDYFRESIDPKADTFLIDPDSANARAKHVYMKARFKHVCDFIMEGNVSGAGKLHHLLLKKFDPKVSIIKATIDDHLRIQNMARFYVYDLSRDCGSISSDWAIPEDGLYESFDFKNYFEDRSRKAYLVKVYDEIAGFVLLNKATESPSNNWNMGEFFIIAKFQGQGIAYQIAKEIWSMHPGKWEVSVIPNNKSALKFWEKAISEFTSKIFNKKIKDVTYDEHCPRRVIFEFDTQSKIHSNIVQNFTIRSSQPSDISAIVSLSKAKRLSYEKAQPQFWRHKGEAGDKIQEKWFKELLEDKNYVMFTAKSETQEILGFIIGRLMPAPEVYNPGGLTLMIDDFCLADQAEWHSIGSKLVQEIKAIAKTKGTAQVLVVCGAHDEPKRRFLRNIGLTVASEWYVESII